MMILIWTLLGSLLVFSCVLADELCRAAERTRACPTAAPVRSAPLPMRRLTRREYNRIVRENGQRRRCRCL